VRITIDIRKLHDFGIGTYVRNLLRELNKIDHDTDYILLCQHDNDDFLKQLGENFNTLVDRSGHYSLREQISIPIKVSHSSSDLFHVPHYVLPALIPCRSIATIHDCIHLLFPEYLKNRAAHLYAHTMNWAAIRKARRVLTVSESSKNDLLRLFNLPEERVDVIYNAIDERFYTSPPEEELEFVRERYQLNDRFLMYAGNAKPHKNLERLIQAFALLRKNGLDDLKLLITGGEISQYATLRRTVHQFNLHKHVRFLGFQSESTLASLYRLADVFVFPSLYEGFGLPPLEAMASGTPVVVSNLSSLPEVVGDAGVQINPYDIESIADGIQQVLENPSQRKELITRGIARAKMFSWNSSIKRVQQIYQEVIAEE